GCTSTPPRASPNSASTSGRWPSRSPRRCGGSAKSAGAEFALHTSFSPGYTLPTCTRRKGVRPVTRPPSRPDTATRLDAVADATDRGRDGLLARQEADGHWVGELEGDTILESEFVLLLAFLGKADDPRIPLLANYLLARQLPDGGWPNYPGGPAEISVSVKAYFALKIAGYGTYDPRMARAAETIRRLGGAEATNSFTRFYLALLGQLPYSACPSVPAEIILLPRWFYFNVYAMSAWSRTIFVPLSVVDAHKPVTPLPG